MSNFSSLSKMTPRHVTWVDSEISIPFRQIKLQFILVNCWHVLCIINCLLSAVSFSQFDVIQLFIPTIHDVSSDIYLLISAAFKWKLTCISSVYECALIPCHWTIQKMSEVYSRTEPATVHFLAGLRRSLSTCWIAVLHNWLSVFIHLCTNERSNPW